MTARNLHEMSKEELIRELEKLEMAERRLTVTADEADRERLIHDLHVHQVELEMQNRELREAQERLEETAARYSDLYDFAPVGYCTLDPAGTILDINLTGAALFGAQRQALIGNAFSVAAPLKDAAAFKEHMDRCARENGRVTSELAFAAGNRTTRTVQLLTEPVGDPRAPTYRAILIDVSARKELEERLRLLSDAGEKLASSLEYAAVLDAAARTAVPALADLCMIDVRLESGAIDRAVVLFADPKKQAALAEAMRRFGAQRGWETVQTRVLASGEPMVISALSAELLDRMSYDDAHASVLRAARLRSLMIVPLSARGRTIGVLTLASAESERRYSSLDLHVTQDLSTRIAMALDNARLYERARLANEALRLAEAKSSGILSISADAIICVDENQRITLFNEGAEKIFGYARAEAIGAALDMLIPARYRQIHRRHVDAFAAGPDCSRRMGERGVAIVGLRKSGEEFPADGAISKLGIGSERILTVALRDATEQKRAENEQRLFAEAGKVLATSLDYEDTLTNLVELVTREVADFCALYTIEKEGLQRSRVACRDPANAWFCDVLMRNTLDRAKPHPVWDVLESRRPIILELNAELLASFAHADEVRRAFEVIGPTSLVCVPLLVADRCLGVLLLASARTSRMYGPNDLVIAERLGRRAALFIEHARLHRAAQTAIAARDDMLGIVAHDLRHPLGIILLQAALLRRSGTEPERRAEGIERAAKRMNRLIEDLLDVSRLDAGELSLDRTRVPVEGTVAEFVESQKPLAGSMGLELRVDVAPEIGEVEADRDRLVQVLENLVGNAFKFTKRGGRITIGAAPTDGEILFSVADTGAGITAEELPHLFDRFWQARRDAKWGAGLGLPIAKGIVEAHHGRIWAESQIGVGSTFFFTLPAAPPTAIRPLVPAGVARRTP